MSYFFYTYLCLVAPTCIVHGYKNVDGHVRLHLNLSNLIVSCLVTGPLVPGVFVCGMEWIAIRPSFQDLCGAPRILLLRAPISSS